MTHGEYGVKIHAITFLKRFIFVAIGARTSSSV